MPPSVYIETSVVSAFGDQREDPVSRFQNLQTVAWWRQQRHAFQMCYSEAVLFELRRSEFPGREASLKLLAEMEVLPITSEAAGVADVYRRHLVMPRDAMGDSVHLAVACVHEVDYLLTWNCEHLANTNKIRHIQVVNMRLGLPTPTILTPEMLVAEDPDQ